MAAPLSQHRIRVLLGAAATALVCWFIVPGSAYDRAAFSLVARGFANPPVFIGGFGSRQTPWSLHTFSAFVSPDKRHAPLIVALGDDPEGIFQSSPPSPVDLAVVFSNFQRLGVHKAASAAVLAWDAPDVIGLTALDQVISRFDSMVMTAPLSRGASPQPMPLAFRKTSVPLTAVTGDVSKLPLVNRIPLPDVILGGKNTSAGFQSIDSEPDSGRPHLLARWEDRVVFAFPLVVVMQRLDVPVDAVEIRPGEYLKLGKRGPVVPIDRYGRMTAPVKRVRPLAVIPAEALIDGNPDLFPRQAPDPVILRDDRGSAEPTTRTFSARLAAMVAVISSNSGMASASTYRRPSAGKELLMLCGISLLLAVLAGLPNYTRNLGFFLTATACLVLQFTAFGTAELWLPGPSALIALVCTFGFCILRPPVPVITPHTQPDSLEIQLPVVVAEGVPDHPTEPITEPAIEPVTETLEPGIEEIATPDPGIPPETPKKRTRTPRKKADPTTAITTIAAKEPKTRRKKAPIPAAVETEKPARKTTRKTTTKTTDKTTTKTATKAAKNAPSRARKQSKSEPGNSIQ